MLTVAKLGAHSVDYYESTLDRGARVGADLVDYYGEAGASLPRVVVGCRDGAEASAEIAAGITGVESGQRLERSQIEAWINDHVSPNGERLGRRPTDRSVRGYDLTFAAPKSVSLLAALGSPEQARLAGEVHQAAVRQAMDYLAEHAGYTRIHNAATGQKDLVRLAGLQAVAYEHLTSRAEDPHLHTHVLVPNKQQREDGYGAGSLDGTSLFHEARAAGMVYQSVIRAGLTRRLGVAWEPVSAETGMADIAGIDRKAIEVWSRRHTQIDQWVAERCDTRDTAGHGSAEQLGKGQKATRVSKEVGRSREQWRQLWSADPRAAGVDFGPDGGLTSQIDPPGPVHGPPSPMRVFGQLAEQRSTWTRADILEAVATCWTPTGDPGEVRRQLEHTADVVVAASLPLTGEQGREAHEREGSIRYTAEPVLIEEADILSLALARNEQLAVAPDMVAAAELSLLSVDQATAVRGLAQSTSCVSVLEAPAGAGKTTTLRSLRALYEAEGRVVVGMAPTGRAADEMAQAGAVDAAETIAAFRNSDTALPAGSVIVVDEAGMVGTPDLGALTRYATNHGCKLVLVGDPEQLAPVKARGGMFALIAADSADTQRLETIWRQHDQGERDAALAIRHGNQEEINAAAGFYVDSGRLVGGSQAAMLDAAWAGWEADHTAGTDALLLAPTWEVADALNRRAQTATQSPGSARVGISHGQHAGVGDVIITTRNDRQLRTISPVYPADTSGDAGPVRNGHRWQVSEVDPVTGELTARRLTDQAQVRLPSEYVAAHVRLGYATTVHAAQGVTSATTHAILDPNTSSREQLYVAASRGREHTRLYLASSQPGDQPHSHSPTPTSLDLRRDTPEQATAGFFQIATRSTRDQAAHEVIRTERAQRRAQPVVRIPEPEVVAWDEQRQQRATQAALGATPRQQRPWWTLTDTQLEQQTAAAQQLIDHGPPAPPELPTQQLEAVTGWAEHLAEAAAHAHTDAQKITSKVEQVTRKAQQQARTEGQRLRDAMREVSDAGALSKPFATRRLDTLRTELANTYGEWPPNAPQYLPQWEQVITRDIQDTLWDSQPLRQHLADFDQQLAHATAQHTNHVHDALQQLPHHTEVPHYLRTGINTHHLAEGITTPAPYEWTGPLNQLPRHLHQRATSLDHLTTHWQQTRRSLTHAADHEQHSYTTSHDRYQQAQTQLPQFRHEARIRVAQTPSQHLGDQHARRQHQQQQAAQQQAASRQASHSYTPTQQPQQGPSLGM